MPPSACTLFARVPIVEGSTRQWVLTWRLASLLIRFDLLSPRNSSSPCMILA